MEDEIKVTENGNSGVKETVTPAVDTTKAFAQRLKEEKIKMEAEIAKSHGFNTYQDFLNSGINKKLLDNGLDPDTSKPIIEELVAAHPDVVKAREILAAEQAKSKETEIQVLNEKYGTAFTSITELDAETKALVEKGVPLVKAYIANHYDEIAAKPKQDPLDIAKTQNTQSMQHIKTIPGNGTLPTNKPVISQDKINAVMKFTGLSADKVKAYLEAHPELN